MSTTSPASIRLLLCAAACATACGLLAGCHFGGAYVIPDEPTAREQYFLARSELERVRASAARLSERVKLYQRAIEAYERVRQRFPKDQVHTPLAMLDVGDLYLMERGMTDPQKALRYYDWVYQNYKADNFLQAQTLFKRGLCYEALGKSVKANELYLECIETYEDHPSEPIKEYVKKARQHYNRVKPK